jgi:hypothetical protein
LPGLALTPATILRVRGMPASFRRQAVLTGAVLTGPGLIGPGLIGPGLIGAAAKPTRVLWTADAAGVVTR